MVADRRRPTAPAARRARAAAPSPQRVRAALDPDAPLPGGLTRCGTRSPSTRSARRARPWRGAIESCVHCGFCLPTCPTYVTMGEEMDSPRGRIFLMKEVLEGQLELETALPYIDNCLGCQACETACPSGRRLRRADHAVPRLRRGAPPARAARTARGARWSCAPSPTRGASARRRALGRLGAARLARVCSPSRWRAMLRLLPDRAARAPGRCPRSTPPRARAARASRCWPAARSRSSRRTSAGRRCASWRATASRRSSRRRRAAAARWRCTPAPPTQARAPRPPQPRRPSPGDVDAVVTNAAGCGSGMREYGLLFAGEPEQERGRAPGRARRRRQRRSSTDLGLRARAAAAGRARRRVAYHDACHLAHAQGVRGAPRALLRRDRRRHARRARRVGAVLRLGGHLQRREARTPPPSWASARRATCWPPAPTLIATGNIGCLTQVQTHLRALGPRGPGPAHRAGPRPRLRRHAAQEHAAMSTAVDRAPRASTSARAREILSPPTRSPSSPSCTAASSPRRRELLAARRERHDALRRGGTLDFLPETREVREADWRVAAAARRLRRPARRDHRPDRPQARHQRAELRRPRLHGRLRGRQLADLAQPGLRAREPHRRDRGHDHVRELRRTRATRSATTSPRCSSARAAGTSTRSTCTIDGEPVAGALVDFGLFAFHCGRAAARPRLGALPLPAQARAPPRGAPVERRLHVDRGGAGPAARRRSAPRS